MVLKLKKIISGGQTGSDQAGLAAGKELGLQTGGWIPRGCRTDEGPRPDLITDYGLKEHASWTYPPRTRSNILESDGTVLFGDMNSSGCALTIRLCKEYNKPYIVNPSGGIELAEWLDIHAIQVLNVAGNRERVNPGIYAKAFRILLELADILEVEYE